MKEFEFFYKTCKIYVSRTPKLQKKPSSVKRKHPALRNMKFLYFFLFLWVIFALLDPDPDPAAQIKADPCGSGSETL
jgi:hypothetical protein